MLKGLAPIVRGRCTECGFPRNLWVKELSDTVPCDHRARGCCGVLEIAYKGPKKLIPPELTADACSCDEREAREAAEARQNEEAAAAADKLSVENFLVDSDVRGHASVGANNDGSPKVCVVTFGCTFEAPPHMFATVRGGEPGQSFCVSARAVTTSQCAFNICRSNSADNKWAGCIELDWHAVAVGSRAPSRRSGCGRILVGTNSSALKECVRIPFGKVFASPPHIFATAVAHGSAGSDWDGAFAITVRSVSTIACMVNVLRVDKTKGWGQDLHVDWHSNSSQSDFGITGNCQFGRTNVGGRTSGSPTGMQVAFDTAFDEPPHVFLTARRQDFRDVFSCSTVSISPKDFLVDIMRVDETQNAWGQANCLALVKRCLPCHAHALL
eukprot:COSAG01_NODE_2321_length_7911_cov_39.033666_1_plen_384_part_00